MKICKICGKAFDEHLDGTVVNEGFGAHEFYICYNCLDYECNNARIISCEWCGEYFSSGILKSEANSFTPCPHCGRDVVDGTTREEYIEEWDN